MSKMYELLKNAEDEETASSIADVIKEMWKAHRDEDIRYVFDTAHHHVLHGKVELGLSLFAKLADQDVSYAEAWNKASTCEFRMGNLDASMAAAEKTLQLVPRHFQALNGLGLVYQEKKNLRAAVDSFRRSLALDPWSPIATQLSVCLSTMETWDMSSHKPDKNEENVTKGV